MTENRRCKRLLLVREQMASFRENQLPFPMVGRLREGDMTRLKLVAGSSLWT